MPTTDTSEKGLESLIVSALTGQPVSDTLPAARDGRASYSSVSYVRGDSRDFDRDYALDLAKLLDFLQATQPDVVEQFDLTTDTIKRRRFLARLRDEITRRGIIDVLRKGIRHGPAAVSLFYGTPTPGNVQAAERYAANVFSVTRQLHYSKDETQLSLDLCLFINGLPVATFELKNNLTKQTVEDAVQQYKRDRDPRELIFQFGRCLVHFALDDQEVRMCTHLQSDASWFLPFNKGWNDGAGNPPNPHGLKTDYLWKEVLSREGLTDIIEDYAQIIEKKDRRTGKKKRQQIFPRYHQLDVVRKLLADVGERGVGHRYLIQHSAGSGKSLSIAWLAYQLIALRRAGKRVFDSIIVVTDRILLDEQIQDTIKQFMQVSATVGHAEHSRDLRQFLTAGKKIIVTTVQKFPFILDAIGDEHRGRSFAIIIDEAHSSQGGRTAAKMNIALSEEGAEVDEETVEDAINRIMEARKMLSNASYFAFTATPKNKTLEIFGEAYPEGEVIKHRPFHSYTMKQAIQERFILDVLKNYTPVRSYYRLTKAVEDDPQFDKRKARKKLWRYVEHHDHAIRLKAEIIVDHFHDKVLARRLIGGEARAIVVTSSVAQALQYYHAVAAYLQERKSQYRALVAFSGEREYKGKRVTEASLNGFPSKDIAERFIEHPYRFLVVAEKFQTGYDEPLLHTMYVDKILSGVRAVQTLSRLNRAHPKKHSTFVLDFFNDADIIRQAFEPYYRTTILSEETDPNKLHDLKGDLDGYQVYAWEQVERLVARYISGESRERLDPILDACVARYLQDLDEDGQVAFKGKAKAFVRTYNFLASILPYSNASWEKLSIFLNFLIPKLPAPREEDLSRGILETIDMESYRVEVKSTLDIALEDEGGEIGPVPTVEPGLRWEAEIDYLSHIIQEFNEMFPDVDWKDADKVMREIAEEIPSRVAADRAYQNAIKHSDRQNARIEHDRALDRVMIDLMADFTELFKQYSDNPAFKRWLSNTNFQQTYSAANAQVRPVSNAVLLRSPRRHRPTPAHPPSSTPNPPKSKRLSTSC